MEFVVHLVLELFCLLPNQEGQVLQKVFYD